MIQFSAIHYFKANREVGWGTAAGEKMLDNVRQELGLISGARITKDDENGLRVVVPKANDGQIEFLWEQHKDKDGVAGTHEYFSYGNTNNKSSFYQPSGGDFYG
jgi:hypothetical protein